MSAFRRAGISLLIAAAVCAVFSWPLAKHFRDGIPSSASNLEKGNVRAMIPGDHLQFLYHMWLAKDTFTGHTPLFYNLYEFNTGDDAERYSVRPYYLPFSIFFTIGAVAGGSAAGWNLTILVAFWITYWISWKLARRFLDDEGTAAIVALIAITLPFPWIVMLGGSPTGFAMMWVPILLYGIDRWIGDKSMAGAALTGAALFFAEWGDTHVFFFNALVSPFWCFVVYLYRYGWRLPAKADWIGWIRASAALLVFAGLAAYKALGVHTGLQSTTIAAGRSLQEVAIFSHGLDGLTSLRSDGDGRKIYVGFYGLILLCACLVAAVRSIWYRRNGAQGWALLLLVAGIAGIIFLSTGVRNPLGPRAWQILMKVVPPYGMIRQPDKIFCILPALLLVTGAAALSRTSAHLGTRRTRILTAILVLPMIWDFRVRLNPTVCLLDDHQGAYAAVASDAEAKGEIPRALVIPLWPGNSHYSSLYEYYVSLYRIRMVNGYRPTPRQDYLDTIFEPFQSINSGYPTDEQLDALAGRGIDHIILHEDVFPEKVSAFPVAVTLANLLSHPRLQLLEHDGPVWSFAILALPAGNSPRDADNVPVYFPARYWDWERSAPTENAVSDPTALGRSYLPLSATSSLTVSSHVVRTAGTAPMEWHVRAKGHGEVRCDVSVDDVDSTSTIAFNSADWAWTRMPVPAFPHNARQQLKITPVAGTVDLDAALLTRTGWPAWNTGDTLTIPAACFYRSGYLTDNFSHVTFRTTHEPADAIFYSKNLYLPAGSYRVSMVFTSDAPAGTDLGIISMISRDDKPVVADVRSGATAQLEYNQPDSRFFRFEFTYSREADMAIRDVTITRLQ